MNAFTLENCKTLMSAVNSFNNESNAEIYRERFHERFNNPGMSSTWNNNFDFLDRRTGIGDMWK